jgi:hypothetical protein
MPHRLFQFLCRRSRRPITGLALVAYLLAVCGYPMPEPSSAEPTESSAAFPCQHHRCGCASAEQCWRSCCCFTKRERLAWAREHNVEIPQEFVATLNEDDHEHKASLCEHDAHGHKCEYCAVTKTEAGEKRCEHCTSHDRSASEQRGTTWVLGFQAQKCHGISMLWISTGASTPGVRRIHWEFEWRVAGHVLVRSPVTLCTADAPPVPPPQV